MAGEVDGGQKKNHSAKKISNMKKIKIPLTYGTGYGFLVAALDNNLVRNVWVFISMSKILGYTATFFFFLAKSPDWKRFELP